MRSIRPQGSSYVRILRLSVTLPLITAALLLTAVASGDGVLPGDIAIALHIQQGDVPGSADLAWLAYLMGATPVVIAVSMSLTAALVGAGRLPEAMFLLAAIVVRGANWLLKAVAESPRPEPSQVRVMEDASGLGFPSSHVISVVLLYGSIIYLSQHFIRSRPLRLVVVVLSASAIVVTGFGRIYTGAHWPSDVLGGYLWGTVLLFLVLWGYRAIRLRRSSGVARTAAP